MKLNLLFVGNIFIYNKSLKEYVIREVEKKFDFINSIVFYKENDNSLFLDLQKNLNTSSSFIIITTKQNFSTIGKLICTITSDNQIYNKNMLIPQKSSIFENGSYLLEYNEAVVNVIQLDEMQKMPEILLNNEKSKATMHVFEEDIDTLKVVLNPIAHLNDLSIEFSELITGWIKVSVSAKKYGNISNFINSSKKLLPLKIISASNIILYIIDVLHNNQKKITFAESCTGGLLSYYFTKENGASKILDGSLITYSNRLKENWLAVENETLQNYGAVSSEVVKEMSSGALDVSLADYAISISGIAGDTGGTDAKPVGTVYIGVKTKTTHEEFHLNLQGDRNYIQYQSVLHAVKILILSDKKIFFDK